MCQIKPPFLCICSYGELFLHHNTPFDSKQEEFHVEERNNFLSMTRLDSQICGVKLTTHILLFPVPEKQILQK